MNRLCAASLRSFFSTFGDVVEAVVMKDTTTRRSRGFGFVVFSHPSSVDRALAVKDLQVDGRKVSVVEGGTGVAQLQAPGLGTAAALVMPVPSPPPRAVFIQRLLIGCVGFVSCTVAVWRGTAGGVGCRWTPRRLFLARTALTCPASRRRTTGTSIWLPAVVTVCRLMHDITARRPSCLCRTESCLRAACTTALAKVCANPGIGLAG